MRAVLAIALIAACGGPTLPPVKAGTDSANWFADATLQKQLDAASSTTIISGNKVTLLRNGVESFARRHENLESARFILVKTFIWTNDEAGRKLADAISAKARAGVPVLIQFDVKGNVGSIADAQDMLSRSSTDKPIGFPEVIASMQEAGAFVVDTNSPGRGLEAREWVENTKRFFRDPKAALRRSRETLVLFDHADHDKYFITVHDGGEVRAIVGGLNIASEYAFGGVADKVDPVTKRPGWRDTDMEIIGPAARAVVDEFLADVKRHRGEEAPVETVAKLRELMGEPKKRGDVAIRLVVNNPLTKRTRRIDDTLRILVLATPKSEPIYFSTPYFAPSKRLRDAMIEHMKAGGEITVLTNSYESSDIDILTDAARYTARELMEAGRFRLLEWIPRPEAGEKMLHHKIATFGHRGPVVIGSANLDAQSFVHNGEAIAIIDDPVVRAEFDAMIKVDNSGERAAEVTREELNSATAMERIRTFTAGELAWYWL